MFEMKKSAKNIQIETNNIVVKKVSLAGKLFEAVMDLFYRISKIALWFLICVIMSSGIVALLNPSIRNVVFNYLPFIN
ncbi:hypothetical protein C8E03_106221 [Lachnotalea glycerini]|uniref:Uncharacterized protein n=1 Tax=Lachnotalea glycerini TaxID=1763509 RepID=A0A255JJ91_9FIRM|nr:hypothetical protein [Lachnotalea glycerini]OYO51533.1 hypothetical protein CG709_19170 [Lachnotalea glycerini]PXV89569.1 hypothetical protein C8E03_106221 [Lachnotalea glycerini]RDY32255.1 hypothetical protein CG710_004530 [Lachnotalea glycerini]